MAEDWQQPAFAVTLDGSKRTLPPCVCLQDATAICAETFLEDLLDRIDDSIDIDRLCEMIRRNLHTQSSKHV